MQHIISFRTTVVLYRPPAIGHGHPTIVNSGAVTNHRDGYVKSNFDYGTYACVCIYINTHTCIYIPYAYVYIYMYTYAYTYAHTHIYIHMYIYIYAIVLYIK